ncbi:MAG: bifunctional acetate--CoA ligase family protein/GNAT family N-acetyltransferase [Rhodospirillaceae bacterium]|jgi:acetyltransferase|nr:bifunctional acetate--CoA ligase family protein/GNAT family N-acetyltransferase [Rhodospirillaceae bacterium]MBT5459761.1 bifunctional acetate--CoA ligase family protein/GNAT family N-acetyltransferase [Rhodospirillaceae bacterium]
MSIRNLDPMFRPESVAVIGASPRQGSVGSIILSNIQEAGFAGKIMPVNPRHESIGALNCYPTVAALPACPDLAILCTPAPTIPSLIAELGEKGTRAAVVLTAGLDGAVDEKGTLLQQAMIEAARPHLLRIIGPNCVGLIVPGIGLNASFAHTNALSGNLAFVSQSGALATSVLDWAKSRDIGFSHFISLGNSADVDFGDTIDYLASDAKTHAILLYMESIKHARKFMSAARAAARNKPVIVLKAGRAAEGARAAASHTGALTGADDVYDAAIRRAGMLRVNTVRDLFDAVETLGRAAPIKGEKLVILTNGGGAGVMATDALIAGDGQLATLTEKTIRQLDDVLPGNWSKSNPVDIIGDAPISRYRDALEIVQNAPETDAILFLHSPTAIVASQEIAESLSPLMRQSECPVLSCWLGGDALAQAQHIFSQAGIPTYDTPEDAVTAFLHLVEYRRNQSQLTETPIDQPADPADDTDHARGIIANVLTSGRTMLSETESKDLLQTYGIPVIETRSVRTSGDAAKIAADIGFPVALKILSPDISHKSDAGGVVLHLGSEEAVRDAADAMRARISENIPDARLDGFTVQQMAARSGAHELIAGAAVDPTFGPVILFGQGGTAVEIIGDRAVALPPLNSVLADAQMSRTRIAKLLAGYRNRPAADHAAIRDVLISLSRLVSDIPEIQEIDINPLLADEKGVLALDSRVRVSRPSSEGSDRLAIRPYPQDLEEIIEFDGQPLALRPIRPEDEPQHRALFRNLASDDVRFRFFGALREPVHADLARFTQIDYDREMAFIATRATEGGEPETLGVVRAYADPDNNIAEFSIVVRSDLKGRGLGATLLGKIITYCRARGTKRLVGQVMSDNRRMLALARDYGFVREAPSDAGMVDLSLQLN